MSRTPARDTEEGNVLHVIFFFCRTLTYSSSNGASVSMCTLEFRLIKAVLTKKIVPDLPLPPRCHSGLPGLDAGGLAG